MSESTDKSGVGDNEGKEGCFPMEDHIHVHTLWISRIATAVAVAYR